MHASLAGVAGHARIGRSIIVLQRGRATYHSTRVQTASCRTRLVCSYDRINKRDRINRRYLAGVSAADKFVRRSKYCSSMIKPLSIVSLVVRKAGIEPVQRSHVTQRRPNESVHVYTSRIYVPVADEIISSLAYFVAPAYKSDLKLHASRIRNSDKYSVTHA